MIGCKRMVLGDKRGEGFALSVGSLSRPDMGFVMAVEEWARPTDRRRRKPKRESEILKTCAKLGQHTPTVASVVLPFKYIDFNQIIGLYQNYVLF